MSRPLISLFGIPVSVSLWHLLWMLLLLGGPAASAFGPAGAGLLILFASGSVLGHEFGHAAVAKALGLDPEIELISLGGVTRHLPPRRLWHEFAISAAGPSANFALAAAAFLAMSSLPETAAQFATWFIGINLLWGVYNLLPVLPLDGGRMMAIGFRKFLRPLRAARWSHGVSIAVAVLAGLLLFKAGQMIGAIFLLMAAFQNWQALREVGETPDAKAADKHPRVRELLDQARRAYEAGDFAAAARLAHQAKDEPWLDPAEIAHVWQVLALSAARLGQHDDAVRYAERVPGSPDMAAIQAYSLAALGDAERIRRFLASPAAVLLAPDRVEALQAVGRGGQ